RAPVPVKKEVLPAKLKGAPNSSLEENLQLARALSASMITKANDENCDTSPQVKRVFDPNEKKRKRPRSYAVVELAPRACKCEVLQRIHDRFLGAFRIRKTDGTSVSHAEICNDLAIRTTAFMQQQTRLLEKLDRLERLSQDMHRLVEQESLADIRIQCIDGSVNGHRCLLQARTSLMCKPSQTVCQSVEINEGQKIVKYWLQYVYSGRVEWEKDDTVRIQKIAEQYGPDDLIPLCTRMLTHSHLEPKRTVSATNSSSISDFYGNDRGMASGTTEAVNQNSSSFAKNNHSVDLAPPAAHSTPLQPTRKKPRFGSNVKILKTTDITPMPDYDTMNDECLKNELRKFGLKPMGRKRSIAILKKIYEEIHPSTSKIDPSTPTIRPLVVDDIEDHEQQTLKCKSTKERARGQGIRTLPEAMRIADLPSAASKDAQIGSMEENEDEDFIDLGDKTLNDPADEPPEESMIDDGLLPKDELHLRMARADTAVCCVSKKALANILDHLGVTFSLSQINGGRRLAAPRK
ncbi:hypothetical protein Angca_000917, partial [Angiostrongylus cantonensis]